MTYVRLAYPSFKAELKAATLYHKRRSAQRDKVATSHLRDLRKLFEFFIPVVGFMRTIVCCVIIDFHRHAFVQAQDYGCYLKMDDGEQIMQAQLRVLHVFLIINNGKCYEYQRAIMLSQLILTSYKQRNHVCWTMFKNNPSAFNEETGEICFSILAREIAQGGIRSDVKSVDRRYRLIRTKLDVAEDLRSDISGDDFNEHSRAQVNPQGPEVKATIAFFLDVIRKLSSGSFRHYDAKVGYRASGKKDARLTIPADVVPKLSNDVQEQTKKVSAKLKKKFNKLWVLNHKDIWPESFPVIISDSDDETLSSHSASSDSDDADMPSADEGKQNRPRQRRQGKQDEKKAEEKKRNPQSEPRDLLNRVLAVPAFKIGLAWARDRYGLIECRNAVMHGTVIDYDKDHHLGPVGCSFSDDDYTLRLSVSEAFAYLVPVDQEQSVVDTEPLPSDSD